MNILKIFNIFKKNVKIINIDENDIFTYLFNTPIYTINIPITDDIYYSNNSFGHDIIYLIPREGDILLDIDIEGEFELAELYQYNWTGSDKIIYDTLERSGIMNPFPSSGFPLNQMGKSLYLKISQRKKSKIIVRANYTLLEDTSRKILIKYRTTKNNILSICKNITIDDICGVKIIHKNKDIYQVIGIEDYSYSPNYLAKIYDFLPSYEKIDI